jgi:S-adenosylmethionine hydrolase
MKKRPLIALLTDFGDSDGYAAAMKGVFLSRCPGATLVDLSHAIPRHDVRAAAYLLWSVYRDFPKGTIFVTVVDPGVGSDRKLACTSVDGYLFLHPVNGILDLLLEGARAVRSVALAAGLRTRRSASATFHGRDILAPAAAALWRGTPMRSLGTLRPRTPVPSVLQSVHPRKPQTYRGSILHIDHFGNMITNFSMHALPSLALSVTVGRRRIRTAVTHYRAAAPDTPVLLVGSSGLLEIAVREGSAARTFRAHAGTAVTLTVGGRA